MFDLRVDRTLALSLTHQLAAQLRDRILQGRLGGGEKLPPSRGLAGELGVARNVVIQAYEQLLAEGYLMSRVGAGTFVADLPIPRLNAQAAPAGPPPAETAASEAPGSVIEFNPGAPDLGLFPRQGWAKMLKEACLDAPDNAFAYGPVAGERQLRSALASYLFRARGLDCRPEQILIVSGAAQGLDLISRLCHGWTRIAAVEDPCIWFVQGILARNGLELAPIGADEHGLSTGDLPADGDIGLIYAVPSHQFPLGGILPVHRRLELLAYARERGALIIEDDYDGEFRYRGDPIQSLWSLAPDSVVYLGTFSKIFSPGLRLGYLIVPPHLLQAVRALKEDLNMRTSSLEQLAMARFIETRALDRHVFRMKKVYAARRKHLIESLRGIWGDRICISGENAGLHLVAGFDGCEFNEARAFDAHGVGVDLVEDYALRKGFHRHELVLGYGNLGLAKITEGVRRLRGAVEVMVKTKGAADGARGNGG